MAKPTILDWDNTAANNTDVGGNNITGAGLVSTADDSFREVLAQTGRYNRDLVGIGQTVGGTATALTVTVNQPWAALANGQLVTFKNTVGAATGAATLTVTNSAAVAFAAKAIRRQGDTALVAGDMLQNGIYVLRYDTAYNSAAGAYVLLNPTSGLSGLATGVATFLATPSSANLAAAVTDEVGTGKLLFGPSAPFAVVRTQAFTSSGTYTPNANMLYCTIEVVGGGGAGGGSVSATGNSVAAGGGGSGGYSRALATLAAIGSSQTVTIGAAGAGSSGAAGGNGGATSVGALCVGNGGLGASGATGLGAAGAAAGTGNVIAAAGQPGGSGRVVIGSDLRVNSGAGGSSAFGGGGASVQSISGTSSDGIAGRAYGSGGSGASSDNLATTNNTGGAGSSGVAIITEYCSA